MPMMYYGGNTWTWGGAIFMTLMMLFWVGILALVLWAIVRAFQGRGTTNTDTHRTQPSAIDILQQRYARGEIDAKTYDEMLTKLTGGMHATPTA